MPADTMSCTDYTAIDSASQMKAMEPAEGAMATEGQMTEGQVSSSDQMAADEDMSSEHMGTEAACDAHPDMTLGDAMKAGY